MANTLKRINGDYMMRKLARRAARAKPRSGREPFLREANGFPPQPTIVSRTVARGLVYLERHGLANFQNCNIIVPRD